MITPSQAGSGARRPHRHLQSAIRRPARSCRRARIRWRRWRRGRRTLPRAARCTCGPPPAADRTPHAGRRRRPARHRFVDRLAAASCPTSDGNSVSVRAAAAVRRADVDALEAVEHVELGQRQAVEAVDARGVADRDRVEPAAAARAPGDRAVLAAALAQPVAHLAGELGRKRSFADARRVRLDHAEHAADGVRRDAEPGADAADRRVRRGDVRDRCRDRCRAACPARPRTGSTGPSRIASVSSTETSRIIGRSRSACFSSSSSTGFQSIVLSCTSRLRAVTLSRTFCSSPFGSVEVADADAAARDLVLVGRPDAARRRADLALAAPRFRQQVEIAVIRQDQVRLVADRESDRRRRCRSSSARRFRRTAPADR